jgi:hypothetical protein
MSSLPVDPLLLQELGNCIDMYKVDNGEDELGLPAWNPLAIGEELAAFVLNILFELDGGRDTSVKGEKDSPRALGVLW